MIKITELITSEHDQEILKPARECFGRAEGSLLQSEHLRKSAQSQLRNASLGKYNQYISMGAFEGELV